MTDAGPTRIFDSHVHFIDPRRFEYAWMAEAPALQRYWGLEEYGRAVERLPVAGMVFVEVTARHDQSLAEVHWVEELMFRDVRLKAIVASVRLTDETSRDQQLEQLARRPAVRGVRDIIQWQPPGYCCQPAYVTGAKRAAALGLHVELCIFHPQMGDVLELVRAAPDVTYVLNHCGKPGIKASSWQPWAAQLEQLARLPNVFCKVSALLTECDHQSWRDEQILPYIEHAVQCFGVDRVMYGGDWPVLTLAGGYADWLRVVQQATRSLNAGDRDAFFYGNAARFYARRA